MKKSTLFISVLAFAAMASCSKNQPAELSDAVKCLSVTIPSEISKTSIGDPVEGGYKVFWSEGDAISVNGVTSNTLTAAQAGKASASFTFNSEVTAPYDVVYPASALLSSGKISFPCSQNWSAGQFDSKAAILSAQSTDDNIQLVNASAFIKVTVQKSGTEAIKEIKLFSYAGEPMSGVFSIDYASGSLKASSDTLNYVVISAEGGIKYSSSDNAVAVFAVPAGAYSKGFAISILTTEGHQMGKLAYSASGITLAGGDILAMPAFTFAPSASDYSGGAGTAEDPYRIATVKDLQTLSTNAAAAKLTAYFKQVADIDMSGVNDFKPIGNSSYYFAGVYDGNGRIISNLKLTSEDENCALFGYLRGTGSKICNIRFKNVSVSSSGINTGVVCGFGYDGSVENCSFSDCHVASTGATGAGLVCGRPYIFTVKGCKADSKCSVTGKSAVGGLVGGGTTYATGKALVISDSEYHGVVTGSANYVGGILGGGITMKGTSSVTIKNCITSGSVTGTSSCAGILGGVDPSSSTSLNTTQIVTLNGCFSSCNVKGTYAVGGIAGYIYGGKGSYVIMNCGFTGKEIEGTSCNGNDGYCAVGGILGWNRTGSSSVVIANCYSLIEKIKFAKGEGEPVSYGAAGIAGYTSVASGYSKSIIIQGCYSNVALNSFFYNGSPVTASQVGFGALYGSFSSSLSAGACEMSNSWYSSADVKGDQRFALKTNTSAIYSDLGTLLTNLNKFASSYSYAGISCMSWKKNSAGYPVLSSTSDDDPTTDVNLSGGNEGEGTAGADGGNFENNDYNDKIEW